MELKPGYKQTEIGVIPEDWEVCTIQELIDQGCILYHMDGNHGSFYPRNKEFKTHGVPYIGANDFEKGSVSFLKCKYLSYQRASSMKKGIARDGDILFAHNATVGPVARLNTEHPYVILSTSATAYRTDNKRLFNEWLLFIMQSDFFVRQYTANMSQTTRNQVPITMQRKLLIPVSRPDEQNLIAAVLSNIDSLITSLEKLINKKKLIKQGVMQELLTGERRLPGFSGEWETKRLGDVSVVIMGQSPDSKYYNTDSKGIPLIQGNADIQNGKSVFRIWTKSITKECQKGAILITVRAPVGSIGISSSRACLGRGVCAIQPHSINDRYLFWQLKFSENKWNESQQGSTFTSVNSNQIKDFCILCPTSSDEQVAIADLIEDIEIEIDLHVKQLNKQILLKQAMMQELLTGRIRLV